MRDPRATVIRDTLRKRGITQQWLARRTGLDKALVSKYLSGALPIPAGFAARAFEELDLPESLLTLFADYAPDGDELEPSGEPEPADARRTA